MNHVFLPNTCHFYTWKIAISANLCPKWQNMIELVEQLIISGDFFISFSVKHEFPEKIHCQTCSFITIKMSKMPHFHFFLQKKRSAWAWHLFLQEKNQFSYFSFHRKIVIFVKFCFKWQNVIEQSIISNDFVFSLVLLSIDVSKLTCQTTGLMNSWDRDLSTCQFQDWAMSTKTGIYSTILPLPHINTRDFNNPIEESIFNKQWEHVTQFWSWDGPYVDPEFLLLARPILPIW